MDDLVQRLRATADTVATTNHSAWFLYTQTADRIEALEAENSRLKAIVHGWHWLAVGPDEMGDYYTQKQLIKASEPYASPVLKEISDD